MSVTVLDLYPATAYLLPRAEKSMPGKEKNIPPSKSRRVAAARAGLLASGELMSYGAVLLAASFALRLWGQSLASRIRDFVERGVYQASWHTEPISATKNTLKQGALFLAVVLTITLAVIAAVRIAVVSPQTSGTGRTAIPLPRLRPSRTAILAIRGFAAFVLALAMARAARDIFAGLTASKAAGAEAILASSASLAAAAGVALVVAGAAELLYERIAIWRALHLSFGEQKRESRDASGDPHVKAALRHRRAQDVP